MPKGVLSGTREVTRTLYRPAQPAARSLGRGRSATAITFVVITATKSRKRRIGLTGAVVLRPRRYVTGCAVT